jgi:hypothetical protein
MTIVNETKPTISTFSNESKNSVSVLGEFKSGSGWVYDQSNFSYDQVLDPITGMPVTYDGVGVVPVIINESKNNV